MSRERERERVITASCAHPVPPPFPLLQRERLFLLASRAGADEYREWVTVPKRGILHVLDAFPSATPPLGAFLHVVGRLQPRLYTIASSPLAHPRLAHVVASVVREEQPCGGEHRGVCTNYFARLHPALPADCGDGAAPGRMGGDVADLQAAKQLPAPDAVRVVFKKSTFSQPPPGAPLLLVGTGTGIAPLRAFLQHRAMQRHEMRVAAGNTAVGPIHLFFGCRHQRGDYLYADEYAQLQEEGVLTSLHTAFSRDGPERPYVQHRLAGQGRLVCDALLLQSRGYMFVCGGTGMGRDVQQTVEQIFCEHGGACTLTHTRYTAPRGPAMSHCGLVTPPPHPAPASQAWPLRRRRRSCRSCADTGDTSPSCGHDEVERRPVAHCPWLRAVGGRDPSRAVPPPARYAPPATGRCAGPRHPRPLLGVAWRRSTRRGGVCSRAARARVCNIKTLIAQNNYQFQRPLGFFGLPVSAALRSSGARLPRSHQALVFGDFIAADRGQVPPRVRNGPKTVAARSEWLPPRLCAA